MDYSFFLNQQFLKPNLIPLLPLMYLPKLNSINYFIFLYLYHTPILEFHNKIPNPPHTAYHHL